MTTLGEVTADCDLEPSRAWLASLARIDPPRDPAVVARWHRLTADRGARAIPTERLLRLLAAGIDGPTGRAYAAEAMRRGRRR